MANDRRQKERRTKTNPFWQPMVDHINATWKEKKGWSAETAPEFTYPFTGRDWKILRHWANQYRETGIMALWDAYLSTADEWTSKHGYAIEHFERQLPRLVDDYGWKTRRETYENRFPAQTPSEIIELFPSMGGLFPGRPKRESMNAKWARKHPDDPRAKIYKLSH